jgi:hypothetical protein
MDLVARTMNHIGKHVVSTEMRNIFCEWKEIRKRQWVKGLGVIPVF